MSKRQPRKRVWGDSIAFFFIICDSIVTYARAAYMSLDLPNSCCYPRMTTEVADMLSGLGSINSPYRMGPWGEPQGGPWGPMGPRTKF